ncbi:MAG TPA: NADH-ubiquinone oxidoreductase-F iron-sulfur binding region domain-containing protein [Streptosporangiaceae bacterium]|nr:NADH-ubiquinone oxidoreductase-F iron-sulfur binding region domain-containing protein [Streptosporangiaceae bacterium]
MTRPLVRQAWLPRLLAGPPGLRTIGLLEHEETHGPLPLPGLRGRAQRDSAGRLIDVIERSGLTGRGGAGFPAGRKLRSVAAQRGRAVVVANGSDGEPASAKDRLLLSRSPHLVLDGISLAAYAVGADRAFLAVHGHESRLRASLEAAAAARAAAGIDLVPIEIVGIPGRYVSSEQSAIVQYLNGGPALPTFAPPRTHERGFDGRPTLVNNAETLAHLALIARHGDQWFRTAGVPGAAGTMLVTVDGAVARPGVYEVEMGTPIGAVLMTAGGLTEQPQAVLTGGYFGTWLPIEVAWHLPLTHRDLKGVGGALGAGIIVALPDTSCGLAETARVVRYLAGETAGQCGPCVFGLPTLADAVADLAYQGEPRAVRHIERLTGLVAGRGACKHPDGVTQLVLSALTAFAADVGWHHERGPCYGVRRPPMLSVPGDMADW